MGLENIKIGAFVSIRLKSGAIASGVIVMKQNIELEDGTVTALRLQLSNNHKLDISIADIDIIRYRNEDMDDLMVVCDRLEKYGINAEMNIKEILNYFILTWDIYNPEEREEISDLLIPMLTNGAFQELIQIIADRDKILNEYHDNCQKQVKNYTDALRDKLIKDFGSMNDLVLLKPEM